MVISTDLFQITSISYCVSVINCLLLTSYVLSFFSYYRSNGEVVSLRPKSEVEPVPKPKLDSEPLPLRPKSVEVDSLVVKNSKESGKKRIKCYFGSFCPDCSILQDQSKLFKSFTQNAIMCIQQKVWVFLGTAVGS